MFLKSAQGPIGTGRSIANNTGSGARLPQNSRMFTWITAVLRLAANGDCVFRAGPAFFLERPLLPKLHTHTPHENPDLQAAFLAAQYWLAIWASRTRPVQRQAK